MFISRPREVTDGSAYDAKEIRAYLKRRGVKTNIDVNAENRRNPKSGRPYILDKKSYKSMRRPLKGSSHG